MSCALLVTAFGSSRVNAVEPVTEDARRAASDADLRRWLENMLVDHRFATDEAAAATGLSAEEIASAARAVP